MKFGINKNKKAGFTLIEALIFLFIFTITVVMFYQSFALATRYIIESKNRLAAVQVANEKMEIIRSLDYTKIGTKKPNGSGGWIYGIPSGDILEEETVAVNTRSFIVKTLVQYIDDPFDYLATGIPKDLRPNDYKRVRVQISWDAASDPKKSVFLVSTFVPPGVEAISTGGILSVNVQDNTGAPIPQASVRVTNSVAGIDQTYPADNGGNAMFFEVPQDTGQNYKIEVSKAGYFPVQSYPPYNPLIVGSFDPVDKNASITNGNLWAVTLTTDLLADLKIKTKDMQGNNLPTVAFSLEGGRKMGDDIALTKPVYSFKKNLNSGAGGEITVTDPSGLSSGMYTMAIPSVPVGYEFVKIDASTTNPLAFYLQPGANLEATALFANQNIDAFLATILNKADNKPVVGASVELKNTISGYDVTLVSDQFGNVYFPDNATPLAPAVYDITVKEAAYTDLIDTVTVNKLTKKNLLLEKL